MEYHEPTYPRSLAPLADRFGQLAYVTFVHEPLLQCAGVP
jgi:hypothetical protein